MENTGYSAQEAIGRNLSFLQGEATQENSRNFMRTAFRDGKACMQDLINYKKDGSIFLNRLLLLPIEERSKGTHIYIGIQNDVTASRGLRHDNSLLSQVSDGEIKHHMNNALSIILFKLELELRNAVGPEQITNCVMSLSDTFSRINEFMLNVTEISEFDNFDPSQPVRAK